MVEERILKPNKIRFAFYSILFLGFFFFGMYMILFYPRIDGKVMGGGISLLVSTGLCFLLYRAPVWKPTLVLNEEGIFINNLPKQNQRLLRWDEIKCITKFRQKILLPRRPYTSKQDYIVIYLKSSKDNSYIQKESYAFERRYEDMKQKKHIYMPINFLPYYSTDKNLEIFKDYPVKVE